MNRLSFVVVMNCCRTADATPNFSSAFTRSYPSYVNRYAADALDYTPHVEGQLLVIHQLHALDERLP